MASSSLSLLPVPSCGRRFSPGRWGSKSTDITREGASLPGSYFVRHTRNVLVRREDMERMWEEDRHGPKMKCADPSTWPKPSTEYTCEDSGYGAVRVRAWAKMHPKVCAHEGRGSRGPLPIVVGTLVLVDSNHHFGRTSSHLGPSCGCIVSTAA